MSQEEVKVLGTKLDILIGDFRDFKKLVYTIMAGTVLFVATSLVAVGVAMIH